MAPVSAFCPARKISMKRAGASVEAAEHRTLAVAQHHGFIVLIGCHRGLLHAVVLWFGRYGARRHVASPNPGDPELDDPEDQESHPSSWEAWL